MVTLKKNHRNIILSVILLAGISFSVVSIIMAATPDPGHDYTAVSGGVVQGNLLYGSAADTLSVLAKDTNATRYLSNQGTSNNPSWNQINLANGVTGVLPVANVAAFTGLGDCDNPTTSKLLWNITDGTFSCGTDQSAAATGWTDDGAVVRLTDIADSVGIGTASPQRILHVSGSNAGGQQTQLVLENRGATVNTEASLGFNTDTSFFETGRISSLRIDSPSSGDTALLFYTLGLSSLTEKLRITSTGNVGIGTTSPDQKLDVEGFIVTTGSQTMATPDKGIIEITNSINNSAARVAALQALPTFTGAGTNPKGLNISATYIPSASIATANATRIAGVYVPPTGVTITTALGMSVAMSYDATAAGAVTTGSAIQINAPAAAGTMKPVTQYGLNILNQGLSGTTDSYGLYVNAQGGSTNNYAAIFAGGNVGIGTIVPTATLAVAGTASVSGGYFGSGLTTCTGGDFLQYTIGTGLFSCAAGSTDSGWTDDGAVVRLTEISDSVGIGTTEPSQQLEVTGSIEIPNTTSSTTGVIYKRLDRFIHDFALSGTDGRNTFIGINAGNFTMTGATGTQGSNNTALGYSALLNNTTGNSNFAGGNSALTLNTTGVSNIAVGYLSLSANTEGFQNVAVGTDTLSANTTGLNNTAVGRAALISNTTGSSNTAIGERAGFFTTPLQTMTNSTFLGSLAHSLVDGITNSTAVGYLVQVTKSNQVVLGNTSVTETLLRGNAGIGATSPDTTLELSGATAPKFSMTDTGLTHAITSLSSTSAFFQVEQVTNDDGGARVLGFSDSVGQNPLRIIGAFGTTDPTDSIPGIWFLAGKRSGTGVADLGALETAFQFTNGGASTHFMTILGSGNVGIGTAAPSAPLHILKAAAGGSTYVGQLYIEAPTSGDMGAAISFKTYYAEDRVWTLLAGDGGAGLSTNFRIYDSSAQLDRLVIESTGEVGIGTSTPGTKLHVSGANSGVLGAGTDGAIRIVDISAGTPEIQFGFTNTSKFAAIGSVITDGTSNTRGDIVFGTRNLPSDANLTERMRINGSGNVGIGHTNPSARLHVQIPTATIANTYFSKLQAANDTGQYNVFSGGTTGTTSRGFFGFTKTGTGAATLFTSEIADYMGLAATTGIHLGTTNLATPTFTITNGGFVGIGTTAPGTKLVVFGTYEPSSETGSLMLQSSATAGKRMTLGWSDSLDAGWIAPIHSGIAWKNLVLNYHGGLVGIGKNPVTYQLDLSTDSARKLTTTTWATGSDARIKTDIQSIDNALDIIRRLRPVKFRYDAQFLAANPSVKDTIYYNFIAQEYQQVFPNSVTETEGLLYLNPSEMIPYAIAGVKALDQQIATEVTTKSLCVSDDSGAKTCISKQQLDALIAGAGAGSSQFDATPTPSPSISSSPTTIPETSSGITPTPSAGGSSASPSAQNTPPIDIIESPLSSSAVDVTAPVITLLGDAITNVSIAGVYTEEGATALDDVDGAIIAVFSGVVDTTATGSYTIHYNATDAAGNDAEEVTRTVLVGGSSLGFPETGLASAVKRNPWYLIGLAVLTMIVLATLSILLRTKKGKPKHRADN